MAAEMQRMRQQLELMQAELICARAGGPSNADVQVMSHQKCYNIDIILHFEIFFRHFQFVDC